MKSPIIDPKHTLLAKPLNSMLLAAVILSFSLASAWAAGGDKDKIKIFPPDSQPYGKSYSQWSAAWWQWACSIPAAHNPLLDQTGQDATINQIGNVWFLAGNFGGASTRSITVPADKALLVPLFNQIYLGFPCDDRNLPGCDVDQALEQANDINTLLSFISPSMDGAILSATIDGVPVRHLADYRTESSALYTLNLVEDNAFALPDGLYHPCVDTGYYLMLRPLAVGRHTLHFTGAIADGSLNLDITYNLTVQKAGHGNDDSDCRNGHQGND
jgi:hypothetical protein